MREFEPQTRFLLRGSVLLIGLLTLWWFVLLGPMLYLLEGAAGAFLSIDKTPVGDWTLRASPVGNHSPPRLLANPRGGLRSIDHSTWCTQRCRHVHLQSAGVIGPSFLAAPGIKRHLRTSLLLGSIVMAIVELGLVLVFAQITARDGAAQLAGTQEAAGQWIRHLGAYLTASVLPYVTPFVVALWLHRELREEVFSSRSIGLAQKF